MQEELSPSQIPSVKKRQAKKKKQVSETISHQPSIHYRGINIYQASEQGNLPLCVLLWGMASSKRINLISPDQFGNNPMHYAALSSSSEVIFESINFYLFVSFPQLFVFILNVSLYR